MKPMTKYMKIKSVLYGYIYYRTMHLLSSIGCIMPSGLFYNHIYMSHPIDKHATANNYFLHVNKVMV